VRLVELGRRHFADHGLPGCAEGKGRGKLDLLACPCPAHGVTRLAARCVWPPTASVASAHAWLELFRRATQRDTLHVPYRGVDPAVVASVSREVDAIFTAWSSPANCSVDV
jgi:hypothetical protein